MAAGAVPGHLPQQRAARRRHHHALGGRDRAEAILVGRGCAPCLASLPVRFSPFLWAMHDQAKSAVPPCLLIQPTVSLAPRHWAIPGGGVLPQAHTHAAGHRRGHPCAPLAAPGACPTLGCPERSRLSAELGRSGRRLELIAPYTISCECVTEGAEQVVRDETLMDAGGELPASVRTFGADSEAGAEPAPPPPPPPASPAERQRLGARGCQLGCMPLLSQQSVHRR